MTCKHCHTSLSRLMALALLEDSGCTVSPGANDCPRSPDGEHDFSQEPIRNAAQG